MSNSADSLKKKVCVTVFLDELFEEIDDDKCESSNHNKYGVNSHVSEVASTRVKAPEKTYIGLSNLFRESHENVKVSKNANVSPNVQFEIRPRKHRKESKFSKNLDESFSNEFRDYGCVSEKPLKKQSKSLQKIQSAEFDKKNFDLDFYYKQNDEDSSSEFSDESFDTDDHVLSLMMICPKPNASETEEKSELKIQPDFSSHRSQSIQLEEFQECSIKKKINDILPSTESEDLAWKKTQKQIQIILAKAKNWYEEEKALEEALTKLDNAKSTSKECLTTDEFNKESCVVIEESPSIYYNLETRDSSNSYSCIFSQDDRREEIRPPEIKRLWTSTNVKIWRNGFESDLSETDDRICSKNIELCTLDPNSLLCYSMCVKRRQNIFQKASEREGDLSSNPMSYFNSKPSSKNLKSKTFIKSDFLLKTFSKFPEIVRVGNLKHKEKLNQRKGTKKKVIVNKKLRKVKNCKKSNILAEGDAFVPLYPKSWNKLEEEDRQLDLNWESDVNSKLTEIENQRQHQKEAREGIAEVFIKNKWGVSPYKIMSDAESEAIFAETEGLEDGDDVYVKSSAENSTLSKSSFLEDKVCLVEIEDEITQSKVLRRLKTLEILEGNSENGLNNISAEAILICENLNQKDLCLEAWQSSISSIRSISDMGQCYTKDSSDSSMYLTELPFHFFRPKNQKF